MAFSRYILDLNKFTTSDQDVSVKGKKGQINRNKESGKISNDILCSKVSSI